MDFEELFLETETAVMVERSNRKPSSNGSSSSAGPSITAGPSATPNIKKHKKRAGRETEGFAALPTSKAPRLASPEHVEADTDRGDGAGIDAIEQLADDDSHSMASLMNGAGDPMENLEHEMGSDGAVALPRRADEFEEKAEREVEASKGLDGGLTGDEGKMKLVHQVRHQVCDEIRLLDPN